jgi:hypothetical protein
MIVSKPQFDVPILHIDEFLPEEDANKVLQECIDLKKIYMPARVFDGANNTVEDLRYRKNEVVYLDEVFRSAPDRSDILALLKRRLWEEECRALWHEGYYIFDVVNYHSHHEAVLSRYGKHDFYKRHRDTRQDHITWRMVTMVYYVNRSPRQFSGGVLKLCQSPS